MENVRDIINSLNQVASKLAIADQKQIEKAIRALDKLQQENIKLKQEKEFMCKESSKTTCEALYY